MEQNAFGYAIPTMAGILSRPQLHQYVTETLAGVLSILGCAPVDANIAETLALAESLPRDAYERSARDILDKAGATPRIPLLFAGRARIIHDQIRSTVAGSSILDYGCGDGRVGELLSKDGYRVELADTYQHPHVPETGLPFTDLNFGLPSRRFDTVLLLTVLHHADDPVDVLRKIRKLTRPGGRVIVIESVYGIRDSTPFGSLSEEDQRLVGVFFDHYYNRIIHNPEQKVNVPFNFNTPEAWKRIFEKEGISQVGFTALGIDQPTVPEYHTLHILKVV